VIFAIPWWCLRRLVFSYRRFGTTYRFHLQRSRCLAFECGTDVALYVGNQLPICAAQRPRIAEISLTLRRKPEIMQMWTCVVLQWEPDGLRLHSYYDIYIFSVQRIAVSDGITFLLVSVYSFVSRRLVIVSLFLCLLLNICVLKFESQFRV
jgi:hypothetical protein